MEGTASSSYFGSLSFEQVLDDLSSRFIVNLPDEELQSIERICFQIEQAHWYYEDFVRPQASHLPSFSLRKFSEIIFKTNPLLSDFDAATAYDQFLRYKERVPVCGAILINTAWDKCLVVKGWKSGASWSFPRGKINQGEEERDCAVREVWEETGYDISPHFNPSVTPHESDSATCPPPLPPGDYPDDDYLECVMKEQRIRLYLVTNVSESTLFETKTRKEISKIAWAPFTSLPTWTRKGKSGKKEIKCYMVTPFVNPLKEWIQTHRNRKATVTQVRRGQNVEDSEDSPNIILSHTPGDSQLATQSQALQAYFFGNASTPSQPSITSIHEPITSSSSPTPRPMVDAVGAPASTSQSRYLQNLQVLSPTPQSPGRTAENLHRQIMRRGHDAQSTYTAHPPTAVSSSGQDPSKATSVPYHAFSSVGSPSYTDYRNSALSPSSFDTHQSSNTPVYTEQQRQEARNDLLNQLASELGTPTPPSADEESDNDETSEDAGTSRQDSQKLNLLALMQQQLGVTNDPGNAAAGSQSYILSRDGPSSSRPNRATTLPPQGLHSSTSQSMLNILNGAHTPSAPAGLISSPGLSKAGLQTSVPDQHGKGLKGSDGPASLGAKQHTTSLLSMFNGQPYQHRHHDLVAQGENTRPSGSLDLARLLANIQT